MKLKLLTQNFSFNFGMRSFFSGCIVLLISLSSFSQGTDHPGGKLILIKSTPISKATGTTVVGANALYSNITSFTGQAFINGGAAIDPANAANTITRLVADSLGFIQTPPYLVSKFVFSVVNFDPTVAISARPRVRFYKNDGAGGGPGTLITGVSFNAITFPANSANLFTAIDTFLITTNAIWAGITFDNNAGVTGATAAQLNELGQLLFDPIDIGTSSDTYFITTANGAFFVSNPIGTENNFGGTPPANFGWEFISSTVLPVTVEFFKGSKQGNANILNWKANCSSTSIKFDIERSTDGRNFSTITGFSATQARCAQPFSINDNSPLPGINYYRLKSTDLDGKFSYSLVVAIINKDKGFTIVGLTPTLINKGSVVLSVSAAQKTKLDIVITNAQGKVVQKLSQIVEAGSKTININVDNLASGTYQLSSYTPDNTTSTIRFVKQ
ncbi:MAG: T9SS type A sorting domain-containing protein [Chitinophagaceae bacterium]|nr:T9SS type A sorting domain-containing protein [Chitinophagaceae bacterium]